jgi:hypothetical protein
VTTGSRAIRRPRRIPSPPRAIIVAAALLVGGGVALVLGTSGDTEPGPPKLLRVTSGSEIATGFAVGGDTIVTVAHVVGGTVALHGRRAYGTVAVQGHPARVLRLDRRTDLALLSVPGLASHGGLATRGVDIDAAGAGDRLHLLRLRSRRTSSLSVRVRRAIVAHVRTAGSPLAVTRPALELATRVAPGDSGAPVFSSSGALAGVVFATSSSREGTAYAVDASAVARLLAHR